MVGIPPTSHENKPIKFILILGMECHHPNWLSLTHSIIFQRGFAQNHQPCRPCICHKYVYFSRESPTWWLIPLSKWVITPFINGISRVNPLITGVITHLLSGMSHQVGFFRKILWKPLYRYRALPDQWWRGYVSNYHISGHSLGVYSLKFRPEK